MIQTRCLLRPHQWKARKVERVVIYDGTFGPTKVNGEDIPSGHKTHVLYVCERCGKPKVKRLKGTWTFEDVA